MIIGIQQKAILARYYLYASESSLANAVSKLVDVYGVDRGVANAIILFGSIPHHVKEDVLSDLDCVFEKIIGDHIVSSVVGRGNWMQTASGRMFYPLDPRPDEVFIEDIAHALSNFCRFGGHCKDFYSVAEHSVFVSILVESQHGKRAALAGLLHDASEAYVADIIRPIKPFLAGYDAIEERVMRAVFERFGLEWELLDLIKFADNAVLLDERDQIMLTPPIPWDVPGGPAGFTIRCLEPKKAKAQFLKRFEYLGGQHIE